MNYEDASSILSMIDQTKLHSLRDSLYKCAIRYSRIRTDWQLLTHDERTEIDPSRTMAHNAFIDSCNILSRNMKKENENVNWRAMLGEDRKVIGDFACYLHCILGIKAR